MLFSVATSSIKQHNVSNPTLTWQNYCTPSTFYIHVSPWAGALTSNIEGAWFTQIAVHTWATLGFCLRHLTVNKYVIDTFTASFKCIQQSGRLILISFLFSFGILHTLSVASFELLCQVTKSQPVDNIEKLHVHMLNRDYPYQTSERGTLLEADW